MRRLLCLFLVTLLSAGAALAQTPRVDRIEITEFGIYELKQIETKDAPGVASGILKISNGRLIEQTATIPMRLGLSFGYSFRIVGSPARAMVTVRDVNIVPEPGLRNPKTDKVVYREEVEVEKPIGSVHRSDYTLCCDWTLVPGKWVFQLWIGDRKYAEQIFTLVKR